MTRLTALFLALTLAFAPLASSIASVMGYSGEHRHYERTSHTAADFARADAAHAASHHHGQAHAQDDGQGEGHDHEAGAGHTNDADDDRGGPISHSHADQVHSIAFVAVAAPQIATPERITSPVFAPAALFVQQYPHPPFRPPQTA